MGATAGSSSSARSTVGQANRGTRQFNAVERLGALLNFGRLTFYDVNLNVTTQMEDYARRKHEAIATVLQKTEAITGIKNLNNDSVFIDAFTPKTVQRYTGRINGAISFTVASWKPFAANTRAAASK